MTLDKAGFDTTINGKKVGFYTLRNSSGMEVSITNYGGRVVNLFVPDRTGVNVDVALGYQDIAAYQKEGEPYFGALIGRYGNRIGGGKLEINGSMYQLIVNNGPASLHGGPYGFHTHVWDVLSVQEDKIDLRHLSVDGEQGYPGNLEARVSYSLTDDNSLRIDYHAVTDKPTVVNLTNHTYFNLNGEGNGTILDHLLTIHADKYTPVDKGLVPTGELQDVQQTPFDFTKPKPIGLEIEAPHEQLQFGQGYDHNFVLKSDGGNLSLAAAVESPKTGILLEVLTTEPGIQFYSGNFLDGGTNDGKGGKAYHFREGFCLETQHFPDSPNKPNFPSTLLKPGELYQTTTIYRFSTV